MITIEELKKLRWNGKHISNKSVEVFEFFGLAWDVEAIQKRIKELELEPMDVNLLSLKSWLGLLGVDKARAMDSPCKDPIILIELTPGELMIVDGCHRVCRDLENGITNGKAYTLPFEEQVKFLWRKDMFDRVIDMAKKKLSEQ